MKKTKLPRSRPGRRLSDHIALIGVVLLTVTAGSIMLMRTQAATFVADYQAEGGVRSGLAAKCDEPAASGGSFIKFGSTICQPAARTYSNPVRESTADPGVMKWENRYYLVSTTGVPWFLISVSDDLVNWQSTDKSVFDGTHPWGKDRFWAPELHRVGNRFAVYYSASDGAQLSIGVAMADSILGPYTDLGRPLIRESFGVIDINFFRDEDGRQYLYWKEDRAGTRIIAQEVDQAGTGLIGPRRVVLQPGLAWEGGSIEGSWLTKKNGTYYMFYSGEFFSSAKYAVGVARSNSPMTPFSKKGDPILRSGNRFKGPGHNSVAQAGSNDYMVYHAWDRDVGVGNRTGLVDKITWSNGWPAVAGGRPTETPQPYPQ